MAPHYDWGLVVLSIMIAILASFVALDLSRSVSNASRRARLLWLSGGALAMGFGIWSMHFIGMLAFHVPGMEMAYDLELLLLSIVVAVAGSALALSISSRRNVGIATLLVSGVAMASAIAGMHYIGMASMRMESHTEWNLWLVAASILIALTASFAALFVARGLRGNPGLYKTQLVASVLMGFAIAGMHYTGMEAATFHHAAESHFYPSDVVATSTLSLFVMITTALILGIALASTFINRAFALRAQRAEEIDRLYQASQDSLHQLQDERSLRERFVSAIAHDLRTPIAAARMAVEMNVMDKDDPAEVAKFEQMALRNLERAQKMTEDLLDANRISAGHPLPLQKEKGDLSEILQAAVQDLRALHGNRFRLRVTDEIRGEWDTKYLRRAIENLCNNALKYGDAEAPIALSLEKTDGPEAKAVLSVHNEGEAIPAHELDHLFRVFHRSGSALSGGQRGWGLGLSIVKAITEAHGGSVHVRSAARQGTTFALEFPVKS